MLTDFFEWCLSVRTFRNLFQTSNFFVSYEKLVPILGLVSKSPEALRTPISEVAHLSHSQFAQDLFVLSALKFKTNGFFVEFGATDGVELSNTFMLEKSFLWSGILCEPAHIWHKRLSRNRRAVIEKNCVFSQTGLELAFTESNVHATLSGISENLESSFSKRKSYSVKTISLEDLLRKYNAPRYIDYLSIDTEGSEFEIINAFNFSNYSFGLVTIEHNFRTDRDSIRELMLTNGYYLVHEQLSSVEYWFVSGDIYDEVFGPECDFVN